MGCAARPRGLVRPRVARARPYFRGMSTSTPATIDTSSRFGWPVLTLLVSAALGIGTSYGITTSRLASVEERASAAESQARQVGGAARQLEQDVADLKAGTRGLDAARQTHELRLQRLEDTAARIERALARIEDKVDALGPRARAQR